MDEMVTRKHELKKKLFNQSIDFEEKLEYIHLEHVTNPNYQGSAYEQDVLSMMNFFRKLEAGDPKAKEIWNSYQVQMFWWHMESLESPPEDLLKKLVGGTLTKMKGLDESKLKEMLKKV